MTKKIAVLVNEDTMQRCSCGGCLKAFMNKADSFERYADEDIELVGFAHSGGDLAKKIESFKKKGVTTVHLSTCTRGKNENYEKDYAYFIKSVGLSGNRSIICESKISPFDYDKHAMIYYSDNMSHPTKERDTFLERSLEEIKKLLEISNGKTLILFTAKTDMQIVYEKLLNEKLPFNILMQQGNSNQKETLKKFREDTNSVLLGTGSYWEGINIEGASLSQVIIFKLPFPIREPIIDYKYSKSRNGLMEVAVPEMIIKLKQGIGRLIRSEEDKGIISIIDSRIGDTSTAPYKEVVWKSLPIKNRTNDIRKIKNFYEDIFSN